MPTAMTETVLTDRLAQQLLGWEVARDRFLRGNRSWLPRWRFDPLRRLDDAFRLLYAAAPSQYVIRFTNDQFRVTIRLRGATGKASDDTLPRAIVLALAQALKVEV